MRGWLIAALATASAPFCAAAQDAGLLAIERSAAQLSADSGLRQSLRRFLAADGALLWPGAPVVAGSEVDRLLGTIPSPDSLRLSWQPVRLTLSRDSSVGITWGVAVLTPSAGPASFGRYISAWQRSGNSWKLSAILFYGLATPTVGALTRVRPNKSLRPTGSAAHFIQADLEFARLAGDSGAAAAFRHWAASDALVFGGNGLLRQGPEEIARGVEGPALWKWYPVISGATRAGDLGWTVGEAVITSPEGVPFHSKYLTIWTRSPDGTVRFITDGGNARPSP